MADIPFILSSFADIWGIGKLLEGIRIFFSVAATLPAKPSDRQHHFGDFTWFWGEIEIHFEVLLICWLTHKHYHLQQSLSEHQNTLFSPFSTQTNPAAMSCYPALQVLLFLSGQLFRLIIRLFTLNHLTVGVLKRLCPSMFRLTFGYIPQTKMFQYLADYNMGVTRAVWCNGDLHDTSAKGVLCVRRASRVFQSCQSFCNRPETLPDNYWPGWGTASRQRQPYWSSKTDGNQPTYLLPPSGITGAGGITNMTHIECANMCHVTICDTFKVLYIKNQNQKNWDVRPQALACTKWHFSCMSTKQ